jgi:hypothetical protein
MNGINTHLSRRTFIFSTAAAVASSIIGRKFPYGPQSADPLHVSIVGFGRHARRFFDGAAESVLYVDAVFDPDPEALQSASAVLKQRQGSLPELIRASRPSLIDQSSSPVLLCSPPDSWPRLIPYLTRHGRPVLAHHSQLFAPPCWSKSLETLSEDPANLLVVGIDPAFPLQAARSFHEFARSRGASTLSYSLWHPGWPVPQLLALHFDCLNAALPRDPFPEDQQWQFLPMAVQADSERTSYPTSRSASCSISATGPGISFGAHLEIGEDTTMTGSSPEYLIQFANFCRSPQAARNHILNRQSELLKRVHASTDDMHLFA